MKHVGLALWFLFLLPVVGRGQIRTQGLVWLEADQARIERALETALGSGRVLSNADAWAARVYAQAERPLRAEDSASVNSVRTRGYYRDPTNTKTYCLYLPRAAAFYLVRVVGCGDMLHAGCALGILSVRPATTAATTLPALTRRQTRRRDRSQAEHLRDYLLEEGRLQL